MDSWSLRHFYRDHSVGGIAQLGPLQQYDEQDEFDGVAIIGIASVLGYCPGLVQ